MGVDSPFNADNPQMKGAADPRLQPTPDYGSLGPGSDVANDDAAPASPAPRKTNLQMMHMAAALIGIAAALVANFAGHGSRRNLTDVTHKSEPSSSGDARQLDRLVPQRQAEVLLEQAVAHSPGAVEQISSRVDRWHGLVKWDSQIASLTTAALNSDDTRVRESGVEVELAAYGLAKNSQSLDYVMKMSDSPDLQQRIWALWALGLLANRGVEQGRVVQVLTDHLKDSVVESRQWAVEALALSGTDEAMSTLLSAMHDDASPVVRERAACSVAQSGMFSHEQRMAAIPKLLEYTDEPALDAVTQAWAFHALSDITHQHLPNDAAAWRRWYQEQAANTQ